MINGVIFDMDGTMFDTERMWATFWDPALKALGLPYKEGLAEAARGTAGETTRNVVRSFYGPDCDADGIVESLHRVADEVFLSAPVPKKPGLDALLAWLDVRHLGGELLLRMEDLDPDRCRPEYLSQLADDLIWLGLDWDLGWRPGETAYCQSCRTPFYQAAFKTLASRGLVYPCYCSRKERLAASAPHAADGARIYSGRCRRLSAQEKTALQESGRSPAWRVQVPGEIISFVDEVFGPQQERLDRDCGDFILRRSDGIYAYQLAVAEDDGRMGVTRVVRGWDLLSSTPRQIWLLEQLGYSVPTYCHVPLLKSPAGRRLSKRDRDLDMGYLRAHTTPEKLVGLLAYLAGLIPRPTALRPSDLVPEFSWSKVGQADRIVDDGIWEAL